MVVLCRNNSCWTRVAPCGKHGPSHLCTYGTNLLRHKHGRRKKPDEIYRGDNGFIDQMVLPDNKMMSLTWCPHYYEIRVKKVKLGIWSSPIFGLPDTKYATTGHINRSPTHICSSCDVWLPVNATNGLKVVFFNKMLSLARVYRPFDATTFFKLTPRSSLPDFALPIMQTYYV